MMNNLKCLCWSFFLGFMLNANVKAQDNSAYAFGINCGGNAFTSSDGTIYKADMGSSGGATHANDEKITGTNDAMLYKSERYGDAAYSIKVPNGNYKVVLHFAETYHNATGKRSFDVSIEGNTHINNLDIFATAGKNSAYTTETDVNVGDGELTIELISKVENAKINAIKVVLDGPGASLSYTPEKPVQGQIVTFDASGSSNPKGIITGYSWQFSDGTRANGKSTTHKFAQAGDHQVTLKVTGSNNDEGSLTKTIKVYTGEPFANFSIHPGIPKTSDTVTIDLSSSFDVDGTIVHYEVDFGDGTSANDVVCTHVYPDEGIYTIRVKVTDNDGKTNSVSGKLSVRNFVYKPRVINTTDLGADPDDEQSMVRQLVSANEFDLEGLIVATGCWKKSQSNTVMLDNIVDAYAEVYPNLKIHANGYPTPEYLRSISVMGQTGYGMSDVGTGKDSPGSELVIESVDRDDPRPVWFMGWGGMNNVAQAIWKVRETRSPEELEKFLGKLRLYDILGQDDAGAWIAKNFPQVFYIRATGVYGWQPSDEYLKEHIQSHGPLGAVYPDRKWATEGDSPAFMHVYPNGLNNPDHIDQGGWGGRFSLNKQEGIRSMSEVAKIDSLAEIKYDPYYMYGNTKEKAQAIKKWSKGYDNDFAARMDWSITSKYEDANHHPVAILNGDGTKLVLDSLVVAGSTIVLSAVGSGDPDGDSLSYTWSFYNEPSSYNGSINIHNSSSPVATVEIPEDAGKKSIHIILEVYDNGSPNLYAYRRIILNVITPLEALPNEKPEAGMPFSPFPDKVVAIRVKHFDNMCWKIATAGGTWYFENGESDGKTGFSSAFDLAGNDWIGNDADRGYNKSSSKGGRHEYRGWPNFGEGNFNHPQRGSNSTSWWVDEKGNKIEFNEKLEGDHLILRSANETYELEYHFFPTHAAIKILKADDKYAFLFEGPVGGEQEASMEKDYYVLEDGKHREIKAGGLGYLDPEFGNKFPSPFFYLVDSDPKDTQVLYVGVKDVGPETAGDEGWRQGNNMVIFSFGRDEDKRAYTGTDAVCVFGFHNKTNHKEVSDFIMERLSKPFKPVRK